MLHQHIILTYLVEFLATKYVQYLLVKQLIK